MQLLKPALVGAVVLATGGAAATRGLPTERALAPTPAVARVSEGIGPVLQAIGPLVFGSNGVLYAADPQAGTIYGLEVAAEKTTPGTQTVPAITQKIAALLGTDVSQFTITDLAVDPRTRNSYLSIMRMQNGAATPALVRVDGAGKVDVITLAELKFSSVALPNAPDINDQQNRALTVTDMAFQDGRLYVSGLSNEQFSSKLWTIAYPFQTADRGASIEIFHGTHGDIETNSPILTFAPYTIDKQLYLIAGYLCTPLVKIPASALAAGTKVRGTTIAELGGGNQPLDMILYTKAGKDYVLMTNSSLGVLKIATDRFASTPDIQSDTAAIQQSGTAGVPAETVDSTVMAGVDQLEKLDATHAVALVLPPGGRISDGGITVTVPDRDLRVFDLP